jgi:hypothetical protein
VEEDPGTPDAATIAIIAPPAKKKGGGKTVKAATAQAADPVASYVGVDAFGASFMQTFDGLKSVFEKVELSIGSLGLDSIEVALSVSAQGTVGILGTGTSVTGTASITVRFARPAS